MEEYQFWPDWEPPYPSLSTWEERIALDREESKLADLVICPSDFVAQGLTAVGVERTKITVIPYGVNHDRYQISRPSWDGRRPLRMLFVGGVNLRKGIPYLAKVLENLRTSRVEVRLVGPVSLNYAGRQRLKKLAHLTGPAPRSEMPGHYQWADVFVFPTLCEGSATVIYEALAAGLPVLTTPNAGSVVRDGVDGFIVPIRDHQALAEKIEILARQPELINWMSKNARLRALDFSLERYSERLLACIINKLQFRGNPL